MPQLDLLIFKYEVLHFIIFFFLVFYMNQYYVFPSLLKNMFVRRKLIVRDLYGTDDIYFFLSFLEKYNFVAADNIIFARSTVQSLSKFFNEIYNGIMSFFSFFRLIKVNSYLSNYENLRTGILLFIYSNELLLSDFK